MKHKPRTPTELAEKYTTTWQLLHQYDQNTIPTHGTPNTEPTPKPNWETTQQNITDFQQTLHQQNLTTPLFGKLPDPTRLHSILETVEQTMFGQPLYKTKEQKAANLLYYLIKNHPFADGNKRIGGFLFLCHLEKEQIPHNITPTTLTNIILLIAESDPHNKEPLTNFITQLLTT